MDVGILIILGVAIVIWCGGVVWAANKPKEETPEQKQMRRLSESCGRGK